MGIVRFWSRASIAHSEREAMGEEESAALA